MSALDPAVKKVILVVLLVALCFVLFIILLVVIYKKRQRDMLMQARLKEAEANLKTLQAVHDEKERISADIHDDMGSTISSIYLLSKLLRNPQTASAQYLQELEEQSNELRQKMKDIIWATSTDQDDLENLIHYIRDYVHKQLGNLPININMHLPEQIQPIAVKGELRKDIFMVVKEAINNMMKHADASSMTITVNYQTPLLHIHIQDNGIGLPLHPDRGNGLKLMRRRLERHGGQLYLENQNGLLLAMQIPI